MKEIEIVGQKYHQVRDFDQFRKENGNRRSGLEYWIRMEMDNKVYLQQHRVSDDTKVDSLKKAVTMGLVYLHKQDYDITIITARKLNTKNV